MKTCFKCGVQKPLDDFYRHGKMSDGRMGKCKECTCADVRRNRLEKVEQYRDYDKARAMRPDRVQARKEYIATEQGKISRQKALAKYADSFPDRRMAHYAVSNAIRDGRLFKMPCMICGAEKVEGHHPDYSRPLDVVWLCNPHHREAHELVLA